jgi:hypothetical protein
MDISDDLKKQVRDACHHLIEAEVPLRDVQWELIAVRFHMSRETLVRLLDKDQWPRADG